MLGLCDRKRHGDGIARCGIVPKLLRRLNIKVDAHGAFGRLLGLGVVLRLDHLGANFIVYLIKIDAFGIVDLGGVIDLVGLVVSPLFLPFFLNFFRVVR